LANQKRTALHQDWALKASPQQLYEVLLDARKFAAFTAAPATIDPNPGGAFSLFGGQIIGRNVETSPGQRLVQAWRPAHWEPGVYSIVRFEVKANGAWTAVSLDHTGFPEGQFDHLDSGWHLHYMQPLQRYFAAAAGN